MPAVPTGLPSREPARSKRSKRSEVRVSFVEPDPRPVSPPRIPKPLRSGLGRNLQVVADMAAALPSEPAPSGHLGHDPLWFSDGRSYSVGGLRKCQYKLAEVDADTNRRITDETTHVATRMVHSRNEKYVNSVLGVDTISHPFGASVSDKITNPRLPPQQRRKAKSKGRKGARIYS